MLDKEKGIVWDIIFEDADYQELYVIIGHKRYKAINFPCFTGICNKGDKVLLNTTAVRLGLGTGGYHFVMAIEGADNKTHRRTSHIMKLRYTPFQVIVGVMEEEGSPYYEDIMGFESLEGIPVISGSLHSMLAPAAATIKYHSPDTKITYIMSDGASLPISLSRTVRELKSKNLIDSTITYGHAFGGDFEAINIYTALIGAKEVTKADIIIVAMGPGIVGSGTKYGFTGLEQGAIIDAINTLGGNSIAIPRISFSDKRKRHFGISHHSITTFTKVTKTKTSIIIPEFRDRDRIDVINNQIKEHRLSVLHNIVYKKFNNLEKILNYFDINVSTMGRSYRQDKEFFQSAGVSGEMALEYLERLDI